MLHIKNFVDLLYKEELLDILTLGIIDDDEPIKRFFPLLNTLLLEFETTYVKIYRKQTTDFNLELSFLKKDELSSESLTHNVYKEYEFCTSSLLSISLYAEKGKNTVKSFECYVESDRHYTNGIFKCLGFELKNGTYIFFNAMNFNNTEIGKKTERDEWFDYVTTMEQGVLLNFSPSLLQYKKTIIN